MDACNIVPQEHQLLLHVESSATRAAAAASGAREKLCVAVAELLPLTNHARGLVLVVVVVERERERDSSSTRQTCVAVLT